MVDDRVQIFCPVKMVAFEQRKIQAMDTQGSDDVLKSDEIDADVNDVLIPKVENDVRVAGHSLLTTELECPFDVDQRFSLRKSAKTKGAD